MQSRHGASIPWHRPIPAAKRPRGGSARCAGGRDCSGQDGAPLHSLLGLVLHQLGDLAGLSPRTAPGGRLAPQDGAAQFALASIALRLGEEEEAESAARRAIKLGMDDIHSYVLLGRLFNKQGRLEEAETAWRKAVRKDPALSRPSASWPGWYGC